MLERLCQHERVAGILLIGPTATTRKPYSDYDMLVIVDDDFPVEVALTYVDGVLTDLVFRPVQLLKAILDGVNIHNNTSDAAIIHWFRSGDIAYDKDGLMKSVRDFVQAQAPDLPPQRTYQYGMWFAIHYNYHQNLRMWQVTDPLYWQALELRFLYTLSQLVTGYFDLRALPWQGEKAAIRYWQAHDPAVFDLFQAVFRARDMAEKFPLYEQLTEAVLEPVGGLRKAPLTIIQLNDWHTQETLQIQAGFEALKTMFK